MQALRKNFETNDSQEHRTYISIIPIANSGDFIIELRLKAAVDTDGKKEAATQIIMPVDLLTLLPENIRNKLAPNSEPYLVPIDDPRLPFNKTGIMIDPVKNAKARSKVNMGGYAIVVKDSEGVGHFIFKKDIKNYFKIYSDVLANGSPEFEREIQNDWDEYVAYLAKEQNITLPTNLSHKDILRLAEQMNKTAVSMIKSGLNTLESTEAKLFQKAHAAFLEIIQSEAVKNAPTETAVILGKLWKALNTDIELTAEQKRVTDSLVLSVIALSAAPKMNNTIHPTETFAISASSALAPTANTPATANTKSLNDNKPTWHITTANNSTPSWNGIDSNESQQTQSPTITSRPPLSQAQESFRSAHAPRVNPKTQPSRATSEFPEGFFKAPANTNGSILAGIDDKEIFDKLLRHEGFIPFMYPCSEGFITVGLGEMMSKASEALKVNFIYKSYDGKIVRPATDAEKIEAWERMNKVRQERKGRHKQFPAQKYNPQEMTFLSNLTISRDEAERLATIKLKGFVNDLRDIFPDFDTYPRAIRIVLLDMIYNMGKGELANDMPNTKRMILRRDWDAIAPTMLSHYKQIQQSRRQERHDLFMLGQQQEDEYIAANRHRLTNAANSNNQVPVRQPKAG